MQPDNLLFDYAGTRMRVRPLFTCTLPSLFIMAGWFNQVM